MPRETLHLGLAVLAALALPACKYHDPEPFREMQVLAGYEVPPEILNFGREQYTLYCYACHGENGDGRGPASRYLRPPPRDFRLATFTFGRAIDGLPHDDDLKRIVRGGLKGTAMLPWDVPDRNLDAIIHYIKTFSQKGEGFREFPEVMGEQVVASGDPYGAEKRAEAVQRGKLLYHGLQCWSCHPAFTTEEEIATAGEKIKGQRFQDFRPNLFRSEPKPSEIYSAPVPDDTTCEDNVACVRVQVAKVSDGKDVPLKGGEGEGWFRPTKLPPAIATAVEGMTPGQVQTVDGAQIKLVARDEKSQKCVFGRCEVKLRIKPPDFTMDELRVSHGPGEIYRTITAGIPGSGMPNYRDTMKPEDRWAIAYYIDWLTGWRGTPHAVTMKLKLRASQSKKAPTTASSAR